MKEVIQKIKDRGEEHVQKMIIIFASISTVIVIIAWVILLSFTSKDAPITATDPKAPDIGAFLEEAGSQLAEIANSVKDTSVSFQETLEIAQQEQLELQDVDEKVGVEMIDVSEEALTEEQN